MKKFPFAIRLSLISAGLVTGAMLAAAVTPLITSPPTANDTVVNFDGLDVGVGISGVDGEFEIEPNGQVYLDNDIPGPFTLDANGYLSPLPFGFTAGSENAGLFSEGFYMGLMGRVVPSAGGFFGRIGVEGRVTAELPSGGTETARGFAGYLQYDPALGADIENDIDFASLPAGPTTEIRDDYVRISKGIPWAFYTEDMSKFDEDVKIAGNLVPESGTVTFLDNDGPVSDPVFVVSSDLFADSVTAHDFIATDDLESQFSRPYNYKAFNYSGNNNNQVFSKNAYCPAGSIRLGCSGGVFYDSHAPNSSPYIGSTTLENDLGVEHLCFRGN